MGQSSLRVCFCEFSLDSGPLRQLSHDDGELEGNHSVPLAEIYTLFTLENHVGYPSVGRKKWLPARAQKHVDPKVQPLG